MIFLLSLSLAAALLCAFLAIVLGRNLTRSVVSAFAMMASLTFGLLIAGGGFFGLFVVSFAALMLATIQLFGWMLVDVDRDHLVKMDLGTAFARSLAFVIFGIALGLLGFFLWTGGDLRSAGSVLHTVDPRAAGLILFSELEELVTILGFAIAAALLSSILLLRDDGRGRG
ncbi:MAG: hypothetical protein AB8G23_07345 [Myxococcota bacterium]